MSDYSNAIEEIKTRCNIVDVIGSVVTVKRAGSTYKACCPFHHEKTPSFVINEKNQYYHCFGCGESGDVFSFVQKYYNLNFVEAVEKLGAQYGITIEPVDTENARAKEAMYNANKLAAKYYYDNLKTKNKGVDYINLRALTIETVKEFGLGYGGDEWSGLVKYLKKQGIPDDLMIETGLATKSSKDGRLYDRYRERMIFPIINTRGKVIGFGARIIGQGEPKYLNSPESPVFSKKNNLFGLNKAKDSITENGFAFLVEGYMDMVSLYQNGIKNVVASLGTALTENQAKLLGRYCKKVILCYDADAAGIKAAIRGIEVLRQADMEVKVLHVENAKDPDEFVKKFGKDEFLKLAEKKSFNFVDYQVALVSKKYNRNNPSEGVKYIKALASIVNSLTPAEKEIYIPYLSKKLNISEETLKLESQKVKSEPKVEEVSEKEPQQIAVTVNKADLNLEKMLLKLSLMKSEYFKTFISYKDAFVSDSGIKIAQILSSKYQTDKDFDEKDLKDFLDEKEFVYLQGIKNTVIVSDENVAYNDCISFLEKKKKNSDIERLKQTINMLEDMPRDEEIEKELNKITLELTALLKK